MRDHHASLADDVDLLLERKGLPKGRQEKKLDEAMRRKDISIEIHRGPSVASLYEGDFPERLLFHPDELWLLSTEVLGCSEEEAAFLLDKLLLERAMRENPPQPDNQVPADYPGSLCGLLLDRKAYRAHGGLLGGEDGKRRGLEELLRRILAQRLVLHPLDDPKIAGFLLDERKLREAEAADPDLVPLRLRYADLAEKVMELERCLNQDKVELESTRAAWLQKYGEAKNRLERLAEAEAELIQRFKLRRTPGNRDLSEADIDAILAAGELRARLKREEERRRAESAFPVPAHSRPESFSEVGQDQFQAYARQWRQDCKLTHPNGCLYALADEEQQSRLLEYYRELTEVKPREIEFGAKFLEDFRHVSARLHHYLKETNLEARLTSLCPADRKALLERLVVELRAREAELRTSGCDIRRQVDELRLQLADDGRAAWYERETARLEARVAELKAAYKAMIAESGSVAERGGGL